MPFDADDPDLDEFLVAFSRDDNEWWRLSPGQQLNLFEAALDRMVKINDERLELVGNLQAANEHVTQLEERSTAVANDNLRLVGEKQHLLQRIADPEKAQQWLHARDQRVYSEAVEYALTHARQVVSQYLATAEKWRYDRVMWAFGVMLGEIPEDTPEPKVLDNPIADQPEAWTLRGVETFLSVMTCAWVVSVPLRIKRRFDG